MDMKAKAILKSLTLVLIILFSGTMLMAQSKEKDEKAAQEAEIKAKKEMLEQQKQMQEEQKKMRELEIIYADQARTAERSARASSSSRSSSRGRTYVSSSGYSPDNFYVFSGDQKSSTQLTLRNSFDGKSHSSKGEFDVDKGTRQLRIMISGKVKSGEIRIIVDYPSGDTFKDMTISSAAEITFSQSVSISEEEPDKYIGEWTYKISAENAEGSYSMSVMTH